MKNRISLAVAVALAAMLAGCGIQTAPPVATVADTREADMKAIRDTEAAWVQAWGTKDVDKITSFYAEDATLLMPDTPAASGMAAIKAAFKPLAEDKNFSGTFAATKVDVSKSGDLGYSQGTYSITMTDAKTKKPVTEHGKYVTVYKKQADGAWKAVEDINNADGPAK
jgi:uncharacterized protein (TIGR02246 family)